ESTLVEGLQVKGVEVDLVQLEAFLGSPPLGVAHDPCRLELKASLGEVRLRLTVELVQEVVALKDLTEVALAADSMGCQPRTDNLQERAADEATRISADVLAICRVVRR